MPKLHKPNRSFMRYRTFLWYDKRSRYALSLAIFLLLLILWSSTDGKHDAYSIHMTMFAPPTPAPTPAPTLSPTIPIEEGTAPYTPGSLEDALMKVSKTPELRYDLEGIDECDLFLNENRTEFYQPYHDWVDGLDLYNAAVQQFRTTHKDLRDVPEDQQAALCQSMTEATLWKEDKQPIFPAGSLSKTRGGYVEPLLPPLRHPKYCANPYNYDHLLEINFLVHDFGAICQHLTKHPKARTAFFDLGASLEFHGDTGDNPALVLIELYQQFGITFDHYYAFEYTPLPPKQVYDKIPESILHSYHWFNVPVDAEASKKSNPWTSLLSKFTEDDFVVIKLDIDTWQVELPLIHQLLQEKYSTKVDQLYFEHHVRIKHLFRQWRHTARGTMQDSLDLFTRLRKTGIAAHSWV